MKSTTKTLIEAMRILANEIHSEDGTANAAIFEASERLDEQDRRIKELELELQKSTDQNDLILDEFIRVRCLTDSTEIHQLCERAHLRMRQNVPVIERNHRMEKRIKELEQDRAIRDLEQQAKGITDALSVEGSWDLNPKDRMSYIKHHKNKLIIKAKQLKGGAK